MRIEKSWGFEDVLINEDYCCKKLVYTRTISSSLHYHEFKRETFVVMSGKFLLETHQRIMNPGDSVNLKAGEVHRIKCLEPGTILEASTHDDPEDCVRLVPSET